MRILFGVLLTAVGVVLLVCSLVIGYYRMYKYSFADMFKKTPFTLNLLQIALFGAAALLLIFGVQLIVF